MRFAWLRKNAASDVSVKQDSTHSLALIRMAYNVAFWIFLLPFFTSMEYGVGFVLFSIVIFIRLGANLYTNNSLDLTPAQYQSYPFRIP